MNLALRLVNALAGLVVALFAVTLLLSIERNTADAAWNARLIGRRI